MPTVAFFTAIWRQKKREGWRRDVKRKQRDDAQRLGRFVQGNLERQPC